MIEHRESINSEFAGTVVDIETIGEFNKFYKNDSRLYGNLRQVILGYADKSHLVVYCAENTDEIVKLQEITKKLISQFARPMHAFNCQFETGVWFHHLGVRILFDGELQSEKYERKKDAVRTLKIPNYDDPFFDDGYLCLRAWENGDFHKAVAHNRSCLLKERDILIRRGHRKPDTLPFVKG